MNVNANDEFFPAQLFFRAENLSLILAVFIAVFCVPSALCVVCNRWALTH
jgi:hypothetical protein